MNDSSKYKCEACKFSTNNSFCLGTHLLTKKHLRNTQPVLETTNSRFYCTTCDKSFMYASGLSVHSKVCRQKNVIVNNAIRTDETTTTVMNELIKINGRLDAIEQPVNNTTIDDNNDKIINNNFDINVFLNETCKDAINLDLFIKNLVFELANTKLMIGSYVDGTCNIIQRNLDGLPLNKRPLHYLEGEDEHQHLVHIRQDDK
jgi:hypothetical protein